MLNSDDFQEYKDHELLITLFHEEKVVGYIAIHKKNNSIASFGATRLWEYANLKDAANDALRLSRTMSYKAALAGLENGGAKGVLIKNNLNLSKEKLLKIYSKKINMLGGGFVTGADVGIEREDVLAMKRYSNNIVGTMTDPVRFTVSGIVTALQESLNTVYGETSFANRSFAIQGVGKIGSGVLAHLYQFDNKIYIADTNKDRLDKVKNNFPRVNIVSEKLIHSLDVDVFVPCALSHCVNNQNVNEFKCKIICGGANNQLESEKMGVILYNRGILYCPDYVANAGGLISVVDEYESGNSRIRRVEKKISGIGTTLSRIYKESKKSKQSTNIVADLIAQNIISNY